MTPWLKGKRVLITRPRAQAAETAQLLEAEGAIAVVAPSIEIGPPSDPAPFLRAMRELDSFDWVVFSSANGASAFLAALGTNLHFSPRVAAVGPSTAKVLTKAGIEIALIAKEFIADALAAELCDALAKLDRKARVLLVQAEVAREILGVELARAGHDVTAVAGYATRGDEEVGDGRADLLRLFEEGVEAVTFASPSAVKSVATRLGEQAAAILANCVIGSIGPVTTEAATALGIRVDVTANPHSIPGLIQALETWGRER